MPRRLRILPDGLAHHVLNRGNGRRQIFDQPDDYETFLVLLGRGLERYSLRLLAFCLMPNHWHMVFWPERPIELPAYMRWLTSAHVLRYHRQHGSVGTGHLYQGRYKSFVIQTDSHLLTVIRYVEANPLRAGLVARAQDWPWSSLVRRSDATGRPLVNPSYYQTPSNWSEIVNSVIRVGELERIRHSVRRGTPYGHRDWVEQEIQSCASADLHVSGEKPGTRSPGQPSSEG